MSSKKKTLFFLIIIRLIILTSLALSAVIIQQAASSVLPLSFYFIIVSGYMLTLFYLLLYSFWKNYRTQAYIQVVLDLFLISALVYISGVLKGTFYLLYVFPILAAGVIISKRAGFQIAALSAVFYGVLAEGLAYGFIPYYGESPPPDISLGFVLNSVVIAWVAFFLIAFLIGYLAQKLTQTQEDLSSAHKELDIKKRLALAGEVFAQVAHEIRNPLASISGSVQVLKKERALTPEQQTLMDIIVTESQRVSHTLEQFLTLTRSRKETFSWVNLAKILKDTLFLLEKGGEINENHRVEGNFRKARIRYFGNENQLKQIFWNLTKNAFKAMPRGGTLTVDFFVPDRKTLLMQFKDTGKGMSEEEKKHIFEPFYSGFGSGDGIGMSVVRRLVDEYGGKIRVESEVHKGTEVTITFPRREY